ncbi:hypothetical protein IFU37_023260 (plasmid) [Pantoea agglomerans]|uniref:MrpH family fimbial adhesin n=1 Tax=Enterobacter agglomerans TaxID=549 RepID=UPI0017873726|nr:hypothetical protein [Pantoea agglomerans]WVL92363.1 hypothetical protein IFU37_023260 [Pantoea agglomerans]
MSEKSEIKKLAIAVAAILPLLLILVGSECAYATAFTEVTKVEYPCNTAVLSMDTCFSLQTTIWTSESDSLPNPCYHNGSLFCWVFVGMKNLGNGGYVTTNHAVNAIEMKTIGEVRRAFIEKLGMPATYRMMESIYNIKNKNICAAVMYGPGGPSPLGDDYIYLESAAQVYPTSLCTAPPPPTGHCKISGDVVIDYGSVSANNLSGLHASGNASIQCNSATTVDFIVFNPEATGADANVVRLRDDNSLSARLTIDGVASDKGRRFDLQENSPVNVTIDSELIVNGKPEAGPFSGSVIGILSLP